MGVPVQVLAQSSPTLGDGAPKKLLCRDLSVVFDAHQPHPCFIYSPVSGTPQKDPMQHRGLVRRKRAERSERDGAVRIEYYLTVLGASMIAWVRESEGPSFSAKVSSVPKGR